MINLVGRKHTILEENKVNVNSLYSWAVNIQKMISTHLQ